MLLLTGKFDQLRWTAVDGHHKLRRLTPFCMSTDVFERHMYHGTDTQVSHLRTITMSKLPVRLTSFTHPTG